MASVQMYPTRETFSHRFRLMSVTGVGAMTKAWIDKGETQASINGQGTY